MYATPQTGSILYGMHIILYKREDVNNSPNRPTLYVVGISFFAFTMLVLGVYTYEALLCSTITAQVWEERFFRLQDDPLRTRSPDNPSRTFVAALRFPATDGTTFINQGVHV